MAGQFLSAREIARRAGGKWRFRENPNWPAAALLRLIDSGMVQVDAAGRYGLAHTVKEKNLQRWISPQIRKILEQSGKKFGEPMEPKEPEDSNER